MRSMRTLVVAVVLLSAALVGCGDKATDPKAREAEKKAMLEPLDMNKVPADVKAKMGAK
jgi:hypothetical protein